jgi:argininosuccinate lyase
MGKLWGGAFTKPTAELMKRFNDSFPFDRRWYPEDIRGSMAYARAIERLGLITADELKQIQDGLVQVKQEFDTGTFVAVDSDEDIHTAVERRLTELIGDPGKKLHTGRSRNDQVATDAHLAMLTTIAQTKLQLNDLQSALIEHAEQNMDYIVSGYTHVRRAQPILWAHYVMSFFWMFDRDRDRLNDLARRASMSPLGAGALAGNAFGLDREQVARDLDFATVYENSLDAVGDRDFVVEYLFIASLISIHLSRMAEDLIFYSSDEFGWVRIDDAYSTGSSIMPQKKNPDSLELIRGKTGRVFGSLNGLLMVWKGTPSTYNKDFQEDKEGLFDTIDTLNMTMPIMTAVIHTLIVRPEGMASSLDDSLLATDVADYLVRKGLPFREAHGIVGRMVKDGLAQRRPLRAFSSDELQQYSVLFGADAHEIFDFRKSVERRNVIGGTAPTAVREQIERAKLRLISAAS